MINRKGGGNILSRIIIILSLAAFSFTSFLGQAPAPGFSFIFLIFLVLIKKKKNSKETIDLNSNKYSEVITKAEKLRKNKKITKAEKTYWQAIKIGENSSGWKEKGPKAKPYKKLAKLYYHTKRDQQALQVIDRYLNLAKNHNLKQKSMKKLKKRLANNNFRRLINKYS